MRANVNRTGDDNTRKQRRPVVRERRAPSALHLIPKLVHVTIAFSALAFSADSPASPPGPPVAGVREEKEKTCSVELDECKKLGQIAAARIEELKRELDQLRRENEDLRRQRQGVGQLAPGRDGG